MYSSGSGESHESESLTLSLTAESEIGSRAQCTGQNAVAQNTRVRMNRCRDACDVTCEL